MTAAPPDVRQLLADAATRLPGVEGRHEAELLLLHVLAGLLLQQEKVQQTL